MQNRYKKSRIGDFAIGLGTPFFAAKTLIIHPRLWLPTLIPWAIAGSLAVLLTSQAILLGSWLLNLLAGTLGLSASGWVATVVGWALITVAWILGTLLLAWLVSIIAIPFADWLAELTEQYCEPPLAPAQEIPGWLTRAHLRRLKLDFFKTLAGLALSGAGLLLSTLPLIGVLGAVILALGLAYNFMGYPQTRRGLGVTASLQYLIRELPACLGFGLVLLFGFAIPYFSAFVFPIAVIGGTLLFGRIEGRTKAEAPGL